MMDLSTNYLGLTLRTPLVPSASPLSEDLTNIKRMEDAGAAAVVLHSLFEEQLRQERYELRHHLTHGSESYAESLTYFPEPTVFRIGPEIYLEHIRRAREAVDIPIIASLNGSTMGNWIDYARQIQEAGAHAIELNIYSVAADQDTTSTQVEQNLIDIVAAVKKVATVPVAVKLSPYFSSIANLAKRLDKVGADGLVLFNRFYQPDIDLETLEVLPNLLLSTPQTLRLPLRWIAILFGRVQADLAATGGVHRAEDVLKVMMAGARVAMLCSVLLRHGIDRISIIERDLREWLDGHGYNSLQEMTGIMSQRKCPDPGNYERAQYTRALQTYRPFLLGIEGHNHA